MSDMEESNLENEIHYVFNDTEYILDPSDFSGDDFNDVIYSDGTRAILVNGHLIQAQGETQTIVLGDGEDLSQYYINDNSEHFFLAEDQNASSSNSLDGTEIVQLVDDDNSGDHQLVYVTDENGFITQGGLENSQIQDVDEEKKNKPESHLVDWEDLIHQQPNEDELTIAEDDSIYQYAILKDGKLHLQSLTGDILPILTEEPQVHDDEQSEVQLVDLSKITGKNLLTGQTMTLSTYMHNLQRKIQNTEPTTRRKRSGEIGDDKSVSPSTKRKKIESKELDGKTEELGSLLNMKITLGKTTNGKKLVGKIIQVLKKEDEVFSGENSVSEPEPLKESDEDSQNTSDQLPENEEKIEVITVMQINKECLEHVSRTLSGLMSMESVRRKLQCKNITVKVVEKKYKALTKSFHKQVSYSFGYMRKVTVEGEDGTQLESWLYASKDRNALDDMDDYKHDDEISKSYETTTITVMITYEKRGERTIRVILNPTGGSVICSVCSKDFRTNLQLRMHMNNEHGRQTTCEICALHFDDFAALQEHRKLHLEEGKLFQCSDCNKTFLTYGRLKRHWSIHVPNVRSFECSICAYKCANVCTLKKHVMVHMNIRPFSCEACCKTFTNAWDLNSHQKIHDPCKYFTCDICGRNFSRHSNLQRHIEIHKGAGALYDCDICGCSYHYISSLTRHVVQNHLNVATREAENTTELSSESDVFVNPSF